MMSNVQDTYHNSIILSHHHYAESSPTKDDLAMILPGGPQIMKKEENTIPVLNSMLCSKLPTDFQK